MISTILLRPVRADDLPIFYEQQMDAEAAAMAGFPSRDRAAFMAHWAKVLADPANTTLTIMADGQVAGNIACFPIAGEPHIGYWLGRDYWGRGVATRALAAFLPLIAARPLYAVVVTHNIGSRRVLEKCGFALVAHEDDELIFMCG